MGLIDLFDDIGDAIFGNKRFNELKHFAKSKDFEIRRKVVAEQLHLDVQAMHFYEGKKTKRIKGYLFKKDVKFNALTQIFDYYYSSDYGTTTTTIFLYDTSELDLPKFIVKPKGGLSKLGNIFTSSEWSSVSRDFDKDFVVESYDMNEMRMMITSHFADVILRLGDYTIEGKGDFLVIYKKNKKADIVDMDNVYDDGLELLDIIINDHSNELV
ncbi:MAG: hypothetical protein ACJA1A_001789 [Saprospiraceae bacterium]|jgi:hypothetical protein